MPTTILSFVANGIKQYGLVSFKDLVLASNLSDEIKASVMGILIPMYDAMVSV